MEEVVRAFTQIVNEGKALYWGTSEWTAHDVERAHHMAAVHHLIPPICDQPQYNLFWRERVEKELTPVIRNYGYGLTIWSPLGFGLLSGKYNDGIPEGSRFAGTSLASGDKQGMIDAGKRLATPAGQEKIKKVKELTALAQDLGCTTAQLSLAWCLCNRTVSTVITGSSRPEQVTENMKAVDIYKRIKDDVQVLGRIDEIFENKPEEWPLWGRWP
jgi:aryl-alcohol dehydrogenase-like predicted oxidoreductase